MLICQDGLLQRLGADFSELEESELTIEPQILRENSDEPAHPIRSPSAFSMLDKSSSGSKGCLTGNS